MNLRTRYRILFNGEQYKIQYQTFKITLFGHWKRKWVDLVYLVWGKKVTRVCRSLERAKGICEEHKESIVKLRAEEKQRRKDELAMKKNLWKKVWP